MLSVTVWQLHSMHLQGLHGKK